MFHQLTYKTFGLQPTITESEAVECAENRLGVQLPAAMREWYARPDAISLTSRQDRLLPLEEVRLFQHKGENYLHCVIENQGVSIWAAQLGDDADPRVIVNVDGQGWQTYSPHFSELIFGQIWDWYRFPVTATAITAPPRSEEFASVLAEFRAFPETKFWPASTTFRLTLGDSSLLIWSGEKQCDWNLRATTAAGFQRLLNKVGKMINPSKILYGNDPVSKELLANMRRS